MRLRFALAVVASTVVVANAKSATTWIRGDLPFERVFEVAAHPTVPAIAFAATASGVFRTADAGVHWQRATTLDLFAFAFNPFRAGEVCALVDFFRAPNTGPRAYCSVDLGVTWSPIADAGINFLLFDQRVADRLYSGVAYGNSWLYVSDDHGKTWMVNGYTAGGPQFHGWAATNKSSTVFVTAWPHGGTPYYYWSQPVYRSRDGGNTWQAIDGEPARWVVATDSTLYFVIGDEVRASLDEGTTWQVRGHLPFSSIQSLASDPANSAVLYAGNDSGVVIRSIDGGRSWKEIDDDLIHEAPISNDTFEIDRVHHISVGIDGTTYAATYDAVFATKIVGKRRSVPRR